MSDIRFELPEINTWRLANKAISQQRVVDMVNRWEAHGFRFGSVCIDDGWMTNGLLGDWIPDPVRFPDFRGLVDWIHSKGYAVRLWIAPAQIHPGTSIYQKAFPDAVLKNTEGRPAYYTGLGTYRLDLRTTLAREHVSATMKRLAKDYAIDAFKVDFPPFDAPGSPLFQAANFALSDEDARTMVPEFYRLVHNSVAEVSPEIRICCASHIQGCQPFIQDTICGDLIGEARTPDVLDRICRELVAYAKDHRITPWLEMAWGEGVEVPLAVPWYAGYLEFMAVSVNYGLKLEHSFLPFDYPNMQQIRGLNNLSGPRNPCYKVLVGGRRQFSIAYMQANGIQVTSQTRFLVAPEEDQPVVLHTGLLGTNALAWRGVNVLTGEPLLLRGRNEFWGNTLDWCRVEFSARGHQLYELWHEGNADPFFLAQYNDKK